MEVDMADNQTGSNAGRLTHPLLDKLGPIPAAQAEIFAHSVKIICGRQSDTNCCCIAGARPGVYATEVNIQNLNLVTVPVLKIVVPLINSGAVVAREPNVADPFKVPGRTIEEVIKLPPLGATMDDCCRIAELLLGASPSGDTALTIALLTIVSPAELSISAVYTANPLNGDGISIDVEYIPSRRLAIRGQG
jgi:hypothetical protein